MTWIQNGAASLLRHDMPSVDGIVAEMLDRSAPNGMRIRKVMRAVPLRLETVLSLARECDELAHERREGVGNMIKHRAAAETNRVVECLSHGSPHIRMNSRCDHCMQPR